MKRLLVSAIAIAPALVASEARAIELGTPATEHPYASAQHFAFELRFSPYTPQIDDEPGLTGTPFADSFGDKPRLYVGLELDWQVFRIPHFGTIGPGFSAGMVGMSRPATTVSGRSSSDEYSLSIYPLTLGGVLRADALWRDLGFPIVPYGKLGLGWAIWRATNTLGTATANGISGKGSTWGYNVALGAAFALDALDRGASRNMDNATGINNTYVYFEYYVLGLNGIGQEAPLRIGTASWATGLAFEF
ncbi:MAG: hypothetical protein KF819_26915 [Labilithrix sp.]|nr:hypothetical protein [Labilithrix sp.]